MLAVEDASCTVAPSEGRLTGSEKAYLSLTRACRHGYHTMSYLFGLNKLAKLMGVRCQACPGPVLSHLTTLATPCSKCCSRAYALLRRSSSKLPRPGS